VQRRDFFLAPRRFPIDVVHPVMGVGCFPPSSFLVPIGAFDSSTKGVVVGGAGRHLMAMRIQLG
jgi:hypothetical protein